MARKKGLPTLIVILWMGSTTSMFSTTRPTIRRARLIIVPMSSWSKCRWGVWRECGSGPSRCVTLSGLILTNHVYPPLMLLNYSKSLTKIGLPRLMNFISSKSSLTGLLIVLMLIWLPLFNSLTLSSRPIWWCLRYLIRWINW